MGRTSFLLQITQRDPATLSDLEIVELVKAGNKDLYGVLVRRYQDRIYSMMIVRFGSRDDALDAAQEAFVKAYQNLHTFRGDSQFYTWLVAISWRHAIDIFKKQRKRRNDMSLEGLVEDTGFDPPCKSHWSSPEKQLELKETRETLSRILKTLSDRLRETFMLHDVQGLTMDQVAKVMGVPIGTVKSRLNRARRALMEQLITD